MINKLIQKFLKEVLNIKLKFNLALFLVFESYFKSILDDAELFIDLNEVNYFEFIKTIKSLMKNAMKLDINLRNFSKQILHLQTFLQITPLFTQEGHNKNNENPKII